MLVIPPAQRAIARVAEMTGLGQLVPLYDSRESALAAFPSPGSRQPKRERSGDLPRSRHAAGSAGADETGGNARASRGSACPGTPAARLPRAVARPWRVSRRWSPSAACLSALAGPATATAAYDGHRLYALDAPDRRAGRLVPFDVGPNGQLSERTDQAITVAGSTTGLLVDHRARSVFVSSRDVYSGRATVEHPGHDRRLPDRRGRLAVARAERDLVPLRDGARPRRIAALRAEAERRDRLVRGARRRHARRRDGALPVHAARQHARAVARWAHALHGRAERALVPVVDRAGLRALVPPARRVRHVLLAVHGLRPGHRAASTSSASTAWATPTRRAPMAP